MVDTPHVRGYLIRQMKSSRENSIGTIRPGRLGACLDGDRIRAAMLRSGESRESICAKAHVSSSTLDRAIRGKRTNRLTAHAIASALKVRLGDLEQKAAEVAA